MQSKKSSRNASQIRKSRLKILKIMHYAVMLIKNGLC